MIALYMQILDVVRTIVDAVHPRGSDGVFTISLVLMEHRGDDFLLNEEVHLNLAFERRSGHTKVLSSNLSEYPVSPTDIDLWGLETAYSPYFSSDWTSGVEIALNRAISWLESRSNVELAGKVSVAFSEVNPPTVHKDTVIDIHSANIYRVQWAQLQEVSS